MKKNSTTGAERLADLLLQRLDIAEQVDLFNVARRLGLRIREVDAEQFDGILVQALDQRKGVIGVRKSIREEARKRFTIAHEIGHFVIPSHRSLPNRCSGAQVESWDQRLLRSELEANDFAAELLLPARLVRRPLCIGDPSLNTVGSVAAAFGASFTATCYRLVELSDEPIAMIWSERGRLAWYRRSGSFSFFLPRADIPTDDSFAGRLFRGKQVPGEMSPMSPDRWLDRRDAVKVRELLEHSVGLPYYEAVLTLLWLRMDPIEEADRDEEALLDPLEPSEFSIQRQRWPRK